MEGPRSQPVVMGAPVGGGVCGASGGAALTGGVPIPFAIRESAPGRAACVHCGVVESVRVVADEIEKDVNKSTLYRVTVRMDDGSMRSISLPSAPGYAVGDRVRVLNGSQLERV